MSVTRTLHKLQNRISAVATKAGRVEPSVVLPRSDFIYFAHVKTIGGTPVDVSDTEGYKCYKYTADIYYKLFTPLIPPTDDAEREQWELDHEGKDYSVDAGEVEYLAAKDAVLLSRTDLSLINADENPKVVVPCVNRGRHFEVLGQEPEEGGGPQLKGDADIEESVQKSVTVIETPVEEGDDDPPIPQDSIQLFDFQDPPTHEFDVDSDLILVRHMEGESSGELSLRYSKSALPAGGYKYQVLAKQSDNNYDYAWDWVRYVVPTSGGE